MKALFYWQRLLLAIIAVSLTATCLNFAYEIHSSWIWAWLGVVPMLLYAYYGRYIESFVVIVLALAFGSINMTHMFSAFDSNIAWLFLLLTLIIFSLIVLLNKFILQKLAYWSRRFHEHIMRKIVYNLSLFRELYLCLGISKISSL